MIADTIITDMDDTLFNEAGEMSEFTFKIMRQCKERGIRVIPSSGRAQASMERFMRRLDTKLPYIACNGAQLVNADHSTMEMLTLPAETAREVCAYLQGHGCYVQVYRDACFYYEEECDISQSYQKSTGTEGVAVGDMQAFLTFDTPKVLSVNEPEIIAELYAHAKEWFGDRVTFTISKPYFLEAAPPEANKGAALLKLAARIGIDPEKTFVFGDSLNDLSMLAFTPNSVAMGNARDEVKQAARYVCRPNSEDGMARFVQEYLLQ